MEDTKQRRFEVNGIGMGILIYAATSGIAKIIRAVKGIPETPSGITISKKTDK